MDLLTKKVDTIEVNVDRKIESFKMKFKTDLQALKTDIPRENSEQLDTKLEQQLEPIKAKMDDMQTKMAEYQQQIQRLASLKEPPFNPDRTVVIYGLSPDEEYNDEEVVDNLFREFLFMDVDIVNV